MDPAGIGVQVAEAKMNFAYKVILQQAGEGRVQGEQSG